MEYTRQPCTGLTDPRRMDRHDATVRTLQDLTRSLVNPASSMVASLADDGDSSAAFPSLEGGDKRGARSSLTLSSKKDTFFVRMDPLALASACSSSSTSGPIRRCSAKILRGITVTKSRGTSECIAEPLPATQGASGLDSGDRSESTSAREKCNGSLLWSAPAPVRRRNHRKLSSGLPKSQLPLLLLNRPRHPAAIAIAQALVGTRRTRLRARPGEKTKLRVQGHRQRERREFRKLLLPIRHLRQRRRQD